MKRHYLLPILLYCPCGAIMAQHEDRHDTPPEEIIVTSPLNKQASETIMPVNILADETLRENAASTLGETLKNQIGVHSSSFGPGVGLPVIRGQSGNRVRVLQDSSGTSDVSSISQDHANSVEALLAERIEIIRGPSTLLYGNGAIGGVINIIDNRIPDSVPSDINGAIELRHSSSNDGSAGIFKLNGGHKKLAWHIDGLLRQGDDVSIPAFAIDTVAAEAAIQHDPDDTDADEEHFENTHGFIANSDTQSQSLTIGASIINDNGFFGASINQFDNEYGIPIGAHSHHDEALEPEPEPEPDPLRIDMSQTRVDFKGRLDLNHFFEQVQLRISLSDYMHQELEGSEIGTVFNNESQETRLTLNHSEVNYTNGSLKGTVGIHHINSDFSAIGDEAFIPASDISSTGFFIVEGLTINDWIYEFGMRVDEQSVEPSALCKTDNSTFSASLGAIWNFNDEINTLISINRSERSASVEELFSNIQSNSCAEPINQDQLVLHAASSRYEIGNPNLKTEIANNIELGFRKHLGLIQGEINFYRNDVDHYIYLEDTQTVIDESLVSRYRQQNASFTGLEIEITFPFDLNNNHHIDLKLLGDLVRAKFDDGRYVPRIPPKRIGFELAYSQERWGIKLQATSVSKQDKVAVQEQSTPAYTSIDLHYDYHTNLNGNELLLFLNGSNLLNEEIRNHTSLLKNYAPAAGRNIEVGARYYF